MRIELFGTSSSAIRESSGTGTAASRDRAMQTPGADTPQDTATISSSGASVSSLTAQALQLASTMESRVSSLREAVTSGQYTVEPNEIADAMLRDGM